MNFFRTALIVIVLAALAAVLWFVPYSSVPTARVGNTTLTLLLATSTADQELGLGDRAGLRADEGMLFIFPSASSYGFWMKDMQFPIDILWLDAQGHVVTIAPSVATSTYPGVFYPTEPATYVLETNAGFAASVGIATGTEIELQNLPDVSK